MSEPAEIATGMPSRPPVTEHEREVRTFYCGGPLSFGMHLDSSEGRDTPRRWLTVLWDMAEYSKRFTTPERLSHDIADHVSRDLDRCDVAVYIEAEAVLYAGSWCARIQFSGGDACFALYPQQQPSRVEEFRIMVGRQGTSFGDDGERKDGNP